MSEDAEPAVGVDAAVRADPTDIVALIWKAFDQARSSGRQDWNAMTVAVLKNRLLDLTQRQFRESDYGARSIFDLVLQLPELLELDESTTPPKVILLEAKAGDRPSRGVQRVRPDLWYAIVDYASGRRYVWSSEGRAVPVDSDEANGELVLPTLSRDEQTDLRANFVSRMAPVDLNVAEKLAAWRDEALSPRELQQKGLWGLPERLSERSCPEEQGRRRLPADLAWRVKKYPSSAGAFPVEVFLAYFGLRGEFT